MTKGDNMYYVTVISERSDFNAETALERFREAYPGTRKTNITLAVRGEIKETILHQSNYQPIIYEFRSEDGLAMYNLYVDLLENAMRSRRERDYDFKIPHEVHVFAGALPVQEWNEAQSS